jgi:alkanesulfonate monooxygenase SsuD/methylene tetrahydromethanopterin reductase-like flavin-dependent oxidoreductase (luciferase family)
MRLGMFALPLHPPHRPLRDTLAENADKILLADRLGFDEYWLGEHYTAISEPIASSLIFMAALSSRAKRICFGSGVVNLPNHHPAIVAAEVALFDHLTNGRFLFGIGPGGLQSDFELFGNVDGYQRGRKMIEAIDIIERIWAGEPPYEIDGEFWRIRVADSIINELGVGRMAKPYQQPHPPIFISVMNANSYSIRIAAQRGWGLISANFIPAESLRSQWRNYTSACAEVEKPPDPSKWRVSRNIVVASTDEEAADRAFGETSATRYHYQYLIEMARRGQYTFIFNPQPQTSDERLTEGEVISNCVIYGSSRTVIDKLVHLRESVGPFGNLLMAALDWSGQNGKWEQESMRRLAEEVMPALRQHFSVVEAQQ